MMVEGLLLRVVVIDAVKEFLVKVGPFLEGIFPAEHSRAYASGDERGLDGEGAAAAHGVDKVGFALPSGHHDDACGQHLVERCFHLLLPIASAVEAFTAAVQAQGAVVFGDVDIEFDVGIDDADVGAVARAFAELVHDGILHLVGHKLAVAEFVAEDHAVHGKGLVHGEDFLPVDLLHGIIHLVGRPGLEVFQGLQYADGRAQLKVGTVHQFQVAGERHHAPANLNVVGTQVDQLGGQYVFQTLEGLGNKFKFLHVQFYKPPKSSGSIIMSFLLVFLFFACTRCSPGFVLSVTHRLPPMMVPLAMVMRPSTVALL